MNMAATAEPTSRKLIDVREGEHIALGGGVVTVALVHKTGRAARLEIRAPREVTVEKMVSNDTDLRSKHATVTT